MDHPTFHNIATIGPWAILTRTWPHERPTDWIVTPADAAATDGPIYLFRTYDDACRYADTHQPGQHHG